MGQLFAVAACLAYSVVPVLSSRGLGRRSLLTGAVLSASSSLAVLLVCVTLAGELLAVEASSWWFVAGGLLAPGMFRILFYRSLLTTPVGLATVMVSSYPVLAVLAAATFQGDRLSLLRWVGVLLAAGGVVSLANPVRSAVSKGGSRRLALGLPLAAAVIRAGSELFRREGALAATSTLNGTLVMNLAALAVLGPANLAGMRLRQQRPTVPVDDVPAADAPSPRGNGTGTFLLEGVLTSVAWLCSNLALARAPVSVVTPIVGIAPALTVFVAHLANRDGEHLTPRVVLGTGLAVAGATLVSVVA